MLEDKIRYDILASEALRGIIRTVLTRVQKRGLPGEHHFYINFDTGASGTVLSKRLKAQYPEEMTIVLQNKFWDLLVYDDRFEVKLSFNQVPERLVIPFSSIKSFVDPSVQFGFNPNLFMPTASQSDSLAAGAPEVDELDEDSSPRPVLNLAASSDVEDGKSPIRQEEQPEQESAKVVELDLFRRK